MIIREYAVENAETCKFLADAENKKYLTGKIS